MGENHTNMLLDVWCLKQREVNGGKSQFVFDSDEEECLTIKQLCNKEQNLVPKSSDSQQFNFFENCVISLVYIPENYTSNS